MASTVYYMDARSASLETGLVPKLLAVFDAAGFDKLISMSSRRRSSRLPSPPPTSSSP
jgi:hypothetical protein